MAFRIKDGLQLGSTTVIDFEGKLSTGLTYPRQISLSGDVVGSTNFDGTANVNIVATIQPNSVALGTDTTGNYVDNIVAGSGIGVVFTPGEGADATISHADTSAQASVNNSNGVVIQDVTLDGFGHVTGLASIDLDGRYYTEAEADSRFVNVTGDTMTGALTIGTTGEVLRLGSTADTDKWIGLGNHDGSAGWNIKFVGSTSGTDGNELRFESQWTGIYYQIDHDGNFEYYNGSSTNKVWTAANDGSGSGLDADLLDGHDSSYFSVAHSHPYLPLSGGTLTGQLDLNFADAKIRFNDTSGSPTDQSMQLRAESIDTGLPGSEGIGLVLETTSTNGSPDTTPAFIVTGEIYAGNSTVASTNKVWHAGNDGSGSGLDADLLDGQHGSYYATASHTHSYLPLAGGTLDGGTNTTLTIVSDDGGMSMLRLYGVSQGTGAVEVGQSSTYGGGMSYNGDGSPGFVSGETADRITFYRLTAGTRSEVFSYAHNSDTVDFNATPTVAGSTIWHQGNDGSGSGLDADTLDGQDSTAFATASHTHTSFTNLTIANLTVTGSTITGPAGGTTFTTDLNFPDYKAIYYGTGWDAYTLWQGSSNTLLTYVDSGYTYAVSADNIGFYNTANMTVNLGIDSSNNVYSNTNIRAPIFYDYNNTAYYIDSNSHSRVSSVTRDQSRVDSSRYPLGHYNHGQEVFSIDPTWTNTELRAYFNSDNVTWVSDSTAPGGYAIQIVGSQSVSGGVYGAGFPFIPVETDDTFYMEVYIKDVSGTNGHYMGSIDYNENFSSLGGNPGSYGYWVMSNNYPGTGWTKYSGYISGFGTATGTFKSGTKYWSPQALFNYSGGGTSYISGWRVYRLAKGIVGRFHQSTTNTGEAWYGRANDRNQGTYTIQLGGNSSSSRSFEVVDYAWTKVMFAVESADYVRANGSFRAPIFYDSNNTGYYADPASTSSFNKLHIGSSSSLTDGTDPDISTSTIYATTRVVTPKLVFLNDTAGDDNYIYHNDTNTASSACGQSMGAWFYFVGDKLDATGANSAGIVTSGVRSVYGEFTSQLRSPVFYDNNNTGYFVDAASTSSLNAVVFYGDFYHDTSNRDNGMFGSYDSTKTDHIWSMGTAYRNSSTGANFGNLYGLAYKHTNNSTGGTMASGHMMVWCQNGTGYAALGTNIWTSGNVTAYSDIRVKTNIERIPDALAKVQKLSGYTFDRTDVQVDENGEDIGVRRQTGVIAQEVLEVLPEAVTGTEETHYSVAYGNMVGLLIEAIKEQQTIIDKQEQRLQRLEKLLTSE